MKILVNAHVRAQPHRRRSRTYRLTQLCDTPGEFYKPFQSPKGQRTENQGRFFAETDNLRGETSNAETFAARTTRFGIRIGKLKAPRHHPVGIVQHRPL